MLYSALSVRTDKALDVLVSCEQVQLNLVISKSKGPTRNARYIESLI